MIYCDLVRCLALGSVPLAFVLGHLTLVQLYLVVFVEGTVYVLFSLSQISALPHVVKTGHLPQAYALDSTTDCMGMLLGPSLSAFLMGVAPLVEIGAILAYLVNSISYLASVLSLLGMHVSFRVECVRDNEPCGFFGEVTEGLSFLWKERDLLSIALLTAVVNCLLSPINLALIVLA
jgi:hypothetical protein